jgi:prepilin-type N-terminal cleavage/methylation domain-containing protein
MVLHTAAPLPKVASVDERGFTLLELMISFMIIGLIVVIVAASLRLSFRSVNSGEKRIDALERMRTSLNDVDGQVQSLFPLTYTDNGDRKLFFSGGRKSLKFATNYSIWSGREGYVAVRYEVQRDNAGKELLRATENIIGTEKTRETTLFQSFDSIFFEYFSRDITDSSGTWVDTWTDDNDLPEEIKIHLITGQGDFSLIIPVRVSLPQTISPMNPVSTDSRTGLGK